MKKNLFYIIVSLALLAMNSCNNDFLEENKKQIDGYELDVPLFVEPVETFTEVSITLPDLKNKSFSVLQYPQIIHFKSFKGTIDETGLLRMEIKVDYFDSQIDNTPRDLGSIILNIDGFGLLQIHVYHANYGDPVLGLNQESFDFAGSRAERTLIVSNKGTGYLMAKMYDFPAWLEVNTNNYSDANGFVTLSAHSNAELKLTVKRDGLNPGSYEGNITIISNDIYQESHIIPVKMIVRENRNAENIIPIGGVVVDSEFDKNMNILYIASSEVNKVYVFDLTSNSVTQEISLTKNINDVSLSEDGKTLFVGQSGLITLYNTSDLSEKLQIDTDFIASDIIDGENGYYYISKQDGDYDTYFYSYNTATKQLAPSGRYINNIEGDVLMKLLDTPYLLITRKNTSPNGINLIDITKGDPISVKYWHQSFGNKLWQKEDGTIIIGRNGLVFKTPTIQTGDPMNTLGTIKPYYLEYPPNFGFDYTWLNFNAKTKSIWGVYYSPYDYYDIGKTPKVLEWDDNTYALRREVSFEEYYTTINGKAGFYAARPHYIFSSKEGDKIILVKNVYNPDDSYTQQYKEWHLEIIDVRK
jgi:hypothetical protein